ncbi:MAG: ParB/RepB/Spo0J family partition protein [Deltaproteobacteria bacterium]|nr:ParB/RepB/Spo0J family partition protein [Deltaproteobacteria bacterium]
MPPKSSLGKGLGAMFPDLLNDISARPSFIICGIEELTPNRFQSRKEFGDQEQKRLVTSIKKNGIIQPIVVRRSGSAYEIIAGERRWRAAQEAGLKEVPIIVRDAEDSQAAELSLIENVQREGLNSLDEAEAYRMLMTTFGLSQEELSARVGKDRSTIANTVRLLKLPAEIKKALIDKTISSGHARALLMLDTPGEQIKVLNIILKKTLSVRETESLIQRLKKKPAKKSAAKKDPVLRDLEKELSSLFMTAIQIRQQKNKGSIEIKFNTAEELQRLVALLVNLTENK